MLSLPNSGSSASRAKHTHRHGSDLNTPLSNVHEHDTASDSRSIPDRNPSLICSATRSTTHQPSESSVTTMPCEFYDGGTLDDGSSVTLQDEFPWHKVDVNKYTQRIPSTIVPALLQGITNVSPSQSSGREDRGSHKVDESTSDSEGTVPRYSVVQKGKWKAQTDGDIVARSGGVRSPSPEFHFDSIHNPIEDWVVHTRPILQDYADRQTSLPLGRRLEISIDEPPNFILGAIQLLVNRDRRGCVDRSRRLGPQLIENFVDVDLWAREYFRFRHGIQNIDGDIPALLTIVMNNFYEGQVQLIDRLVEFALENMRVRGRSSLSVEDFAFGFDFKMSQDLPFYVETSSRIREPLPIRAVEVPRFSEPVITHSGRQVKPTERAQAASEQAQANAGGRRNKEKDTFQVKENQVEKDPACHEKNSEQCSSQRTEVVTSQTESYSVAPLPTKTTSERMKHRPVRPSNLGSPPILPGPSSPAGTVLSQSDDGSESEPSTSTEAESPKVFGSKGSNLTLHAPPRLKIILPPLNLPTSTIPMTSRSESISNNIQSSVLQVNPPANASVAPNTGRGVLRFRCARGPRNGRGRGRGRERGSTTPTLNADEALEPTPDDREARPTNPDVGNAEVSLAVNPPVTSPTLVVAPRSVEGTTKVHSHGAHNSIDTGDKRSSTSRRTRGGQSPVPVSDPGHLQGKKRKLDDCED